MSSHTNFLGIPVEGDITKGETQVPQKPLSELEPLMRAVLDDPTMKAFGWTQYTPYFNDGDPCVFSVGEPWFRTVDDVKDKTSDGDGDYDDEDDDSYGIGYGEHPSLGKQDYEWDNPRDWENRRKIYGPYQGNRQSSFTVCSALADAINSGAFEDVLLEAFGDHAEVKVRASGITVDSYSHD
jgi:hypothetical protein